MVHTSSPHSLHLERVNRIGGANFPLFGVSVAPAHTPPELSMPRPQFSTRSPSRLPPFCILPSRPKLSYDMSVPLPPCGVPHPHCGMVLDVWGRSCPPHRIVVVGSSSWLARSSSTLGGAGLPLRYLRSWARSCRCAHRRPGWDALRRVEGWSVGR